MSQAKIPIIYVWIYNKLKEKNRGIFIETQFLKEWIGRTILRKGGVPHCYTYDIIKDMENMNLIKRLNHLKYRILKSNCEKRLKKYIWE